MATNSPVPYVTHNTYVQPNQSGYVFNYNPGYQCSNCGQWVYGYQPHTCYHYPQPTQTIIYQTVPVPPAQPDTQAELRAVKKELKEVRNLLEKLMELAVNEHEEVRRRDEEGSEHPASDTRGSRQSSIRIDVTAEASRHLGL